MEIKYKVGLRCFEAFVYIIIVCAFKTSKLEPI